MNVEKINSASSIACEPMNENGSVRHIYSTCLRLELVFIGTKTISTFRLLNDSQGEFFV